ncbi:hypothetical protein U1Q18_023610 [Sarracenia purpurea var. burkii]
MNSRSGTNLRSCRREIAVAGAKSRSCRRELAKLQAQNREVDEVAGDERRVREDDVRNRQIAVAGDEQRAGEDDVRNRQIACRRRAKSPNRRGKSRRTKNWGRRRAG